MIKIYVECREDSQSALLMIYPIRYECMACIFFISSMSHKLTRNGSSSWNTPQATTEGQSKKDLGGIGLWLNVSKYGFPETNLQASRNVLACRLFGHKSSRLDGPSLPLGPPVCSICAPFCINLLANHLRPHWTRSIWRWSRTRPTQGQAKNKPSDIFVSLSQLTSSS